MADYTITLTDEQDATLASHIEVNDAKTVQDLLETTIAALCVQVAKAETVRKWEKLSDTAKAVAIEAGETEDAKVVEVVEK